jgi:hypothetical protein
MSADFDPNAIPEPPRLLWQEQGQMEDAPICSPTVVELLGEVKRGFEELGRSIIRTALPGLRALLEMVEKEMEKDARPRS